MPLSIVFIGSNLSVSAVQGHEDLDLVQGLRLVHPGLRHRAALALIG